MFGKKHVLTIAGYITNGFDNNVHIPQDLLLLVSSIDFASSALLLAEK